MLKRLRDFYIHDLYVTRLGTEIKEKNILFVMGGPGLNTWSVVNYALNENLFSNLNANIFFYDPRDCGQSNNNSKVTNNYQQQIEDLKTVYEKLNLEYGIEAIVAHSYGAKLLSDLYFQYNISNKYIFVSTAKDIDTPRANNIKLDLEYLKTTDTELYNQIISDMKSQSTWEVTTALESTFQKNPNRIDRYWYNKEVKEKYLKLQKESPFPMNAQTFTSLRKELYESESRLLNLDKIEAEWNLLIGKHDYIMSGESVSNDEHTITFENSAHYPHLEENEKFCKVINEILN